MASDHSQFPLFSQPLDLLSTGALSSLFSRSYPGPFSWDNRDEDHRGDCCLSPESTIIINKLLLTETMIGGEGTDDDQ
jgi:hypothetical protein